MKLKHAVLSVMDRDALKRAIDELEMDGVDRRSREDMAAKLSRAHRATPELLLGLVGEAQVKQVCELLGLSSVGRRRALVEALLEAGRQPARTRRPRAQPTSGPRESPSQKRSEPMAKKKRTGAGNPKQVTRYTYDEVKEPRTPETGHTALLPADEQVVTLPMDNGWSKAVEVGRLPEGDERPVVLDMDPAADPVLFWAGKRNKRQVPILPLQRNEIVTESRIAQIIERAQEAAASKGPQARQQTLFADLEKSLREADRKKRVEFYTHDEGWKNKLICGDSLHVMESLLHYEGLRGKVQMIYIDPPYGIKYDSNFQQRIDSTKNDAKDQADDVLTIKAFRDTWSLGIHSYLGYLQERLYLSRELLAESGSVFVQINDDNAHRVLALLDEVFGADNRCAVIPFSKTSGQESGGLATVCDFLLWYAKSRPQLKYRQLYRGLGVDVSDASYNCVELPDGSWRRLTAAEQRGDAGRKALPDLKRHVAGRDRDGLAAVYVRGEAVSALARQPLEGTHRGNDEAR